MTLINKIVLSSAERLETTTSCIAYISHIIGSRGITLGLEESHRFSRIHRSSVAVSLSEYEYMDLSAYRSDR